MITVWYVSSGLVTGGCVINSWCCNVVDVGYDNVL